jgi:hypothetical protein
MRCTRHSRGQRRRIHEQAADQPCPEQEQHSAGRRSRRLSGMIRRANNISALVLRCGLIVMRVFPIMPHEPRAAQKADLARVPRSAATIRDGSQASYALSGAASASIPAPALNTT